MACLLDTFTDSKGRQKLDNMIKNKLIREKQIRFAHEFVEGRDRADMEDFFAPKEYLKMFQEAFPEHKDAKLDHIGLDSQPIIAEINRAIGVQRFNHYRPANWLVQQGVTASFFAPETLDVFENVMRTMNSLFKK